MRRILLMLAGSALVSQVPVIAAPMRGDTPKPPEQTPPNGKKGSTPGVSKADATLINSTNAAAQLKLDAKDFAGAAADYQKAIDASPNNPARHILYAGLAMTLRRQGIAAYNSGTKPELPAPGASNDAIRAYNIAAAQSQAERTALAVPLLKRSIEAAAAAAAISDAATVKMADGAIAVEMREDAALLYALDRKGTLTVARPSVGLEAVWLRRWLTATNPLAEALAARFGIAVAANLVAKDPAAGLALADEVKARTGADADGAMGFAEIVVAANTPAGDPHRAAALAALTAIEGTVADGQQKRRIVELKAALGKSA